MNRFLFIASTFLFWLVVGGFWWVSTDEGEPVNAPTPLRTIALTELAQHGTSQSCWMAIQGAVYDISAYVPEHPSRPEVVLAWCGKDASHAYATKMRNRPHSPAADGQLAQYRMGTLADIP